jgi:hypothetical protein
MWKEAVVTFLSEYYPVFPGGTQENHKKLRIAGLKFKPRTSRI